MQPRRVISSSIRQNGRFGYIDQTGAIVIPPRFTAASDFAEGRAFITDGDKAGYIDAGGAQITPSRFQPGSFAFHEGLAAVRVDGAWGYIDANGAQIIPPRFAEVGDFHDGLAAARQGSFYGFIDRIGSLRHRGPLRFRRSVLRRAGADPRWDENGLHRPLGYGRHPRPVR